MMKALLLNTIILILFLCGCERIFMEANPETSNTAIFEEYWKLVNEKFGMFNDPSKNLDKDALYKKYKPLINDNLTENQLYNIMGNLVIELKDGHSYLSRGKGDTITFNTTQNTPRNLNSITVTNYLILKSGGENHRLGGIEYAMIENNTIGYMRYGDFDNEITEEHVDTILHFFRLTKGLILDMRGNPGGNPSYAALLASHFTNSQVYVGKEIFKIGPNLNDYKASELYLKPASGVKYFKPVYVLTNIECYSATTTLIYYLNPLPNVHFVGQKTGGGTGSVAEGFLANGWMWGLSVSSFIDFEGNEQLDAGFEPDIKVSDKQSTLLVDEIIERAILEINKS